MALASKIDQGRSLSLRAPQGCLRLRAKQAEAHPAEILAGSCWYKKQARHTPSRLPTIHLSKSKAHQTAFADRFVTAVIQQGREEYADIRPRVNGFEV